MTRNLFSSWAELKKHSSAVIYVDIPKAFYSVLVEEVVGPVMGRSDRAKVIANLKNQPIIGQLVLCSQPVSENIELSNKIVNILKAPTRL